MVFAYFLPSGGSKIDQKSIKIASQSGLKLRCRKNTQKSSEMVPTWFQKRPKLGGQNALGPVWGPSKSEERTTPKTRPKNNTPLEASWVGEAKKSFGGTDPRSGWIANLQELAKIGLVSSTAAPLRGGTRSTCPAGQPRHRALGLSWLVGWVS